MEPIDDEIIVTVRLRVDGPDTRDAIAEEALEQLPVRLLRAVQPILDGRPGVELAGVEIALPTLRPYHVPKVVHEFTPPERQVTPLRP